MKPYQFQLSYSAESEFAQLPSLLQKRIWKKLKFFEKQKNPLHFAKRMQGVENTFRFRIGNYRVIVTPKDQKTFIILLILKIGDRKDVYE